VSGVGSSSSSLYCHLPSWQQQQHRLAKAAGAELALPAVANFNQLVLTASPTPTTDMPCLHNELFTAAAATAGVGVHMCFSQQQQRHVENHNYINMAAQTAADAGHNTATSPGSLPPAGAPQVPSQAVSPLQAAAVSGTAATAIAAAAAAAMQYEGTPMMTGEDGACLHGTSSASGGDQQMQMLLQLMQQQLAFQQQQQSWVAPHHGQQLVGFLDQRNAPMSQYDLALVNGLADDGTAVVQLSTGSNSNHHLSSQVHTAGAAATAAGSGGNIWCLLPQQQLHNSSAVPATAVGSWADPAGTMAAQQVQLLSAAAAAASCTTSPGTPGGVATSTAPVAFLLQLPAASSAVVARAPGEPDALQEVQQLHTLPANRPGPAGR
jgi:hypothetical protein